MKNLFTIIIFLIWSISNAQCLTNGTLDATSIGNNGITSVQSWQGTHGSPSTSGVVNTNTWVWMWSHTNRGEGIFTNYNFVANRTYQISFDIRTDANINNPNNTVLNSWVYAKVFNNLTTNSSNAIPPALLNSGQIVLQNTVSAYRGNNWTTVTISFVPNQNYTQLCFFPAMTASSALNGRAQIEMEIDNVTITPPVTSVFHFEDASSNMKTDFCEGEDIFLNGTASFGENQYYLDIWRRPIGSTGAFQWQDKLGSNGWTSGQLGVLNLSSLFGSQGYNFIPGYEYEVKVATSSSPCVGWVPSTHIFRVLSSNGSPAFTFNSFCAPNGTISVTVTATDTTVGLNHWWGLIETSVAGSTTDATSLGLVGSIQSGTTTTFTGLSKDKNYYIKHGVYNSCVSWRELRIALPQNVYWSGYTTNFSINASNIGNNVHVTAIAASNPVFVSHHWSISYAPNGSTTGNNPVGVTPTLSPDGMTATFNSGLVINTWYYIKHGTWNDCAPWGETRKAFKVVIQGLLANGEPEYAVQTKDVKQVENISLGKTTNKLENIATQEQLYPNPVKRDAFCSLTTDSKNVSKVVIADLLGKTKTILFSIKDTNTITFQIDNSITKGIYIVKIIKKDNTITSKKLIVE
ncbi:T9SS type A sorting domain-containing protein [Flavobacterium jejuense]|uniref:T9SS type A sorting domain-containing protein n=1 Tax=Flavobacterium jejuense TaxID=1544455 RepID=A0ABX0IWR9_9FLAO|nr:T9SS type A sorting domain-containing protein [Flavobacterium jejuense]NHN28011.1 T9SS type A sorting domain-containing protein [Flavobacterium jejuense]